MSTPSVDPERMLCGVCGRVLDHVTDANGNLAGYRHSLMDSENEDHPAVPVSANSMPGRLRCDFCGTEEPTLVVPAKSFVIAPGQGSTGDWAACDICGGLIDRDQWTRLVDRVVTEHVARQAWSVPAEYMRSATARAYRLLRKNITGPLRPVDSSGA